MTLTMIAKIQIKHKYTILDEIMEVNVIDK